MIPSLLQTTNCTEQGARVPLASVSMVSKLRAEAHKDSTKLHTFSLCPILLTSANQQPFFESVKTTVAEEKLSVCLSLQIKRLMRPQSATGGSKSHETPQEEQVINSETSWLPCYTFARCVRSLKQTSRAPEAEPPPPTTANTPPPSNTPPSCRQALKASPAHSAESPTQGLFVGLKHPISKTCTVKPKET